MPEPKSRSFSFVIRSLLLAALPLSAWGACTPTTYTVTDTADSGPGSLRAAVTASNSCPGSTITFSVTGTITLASRILISAPMTISGPGVANLTISGGNTTRIFFIDPGSGSSVSITNLTLANGYGLGGSSDFGGGAAGMGGAIFQNSGTLGITGVTFSGNKAQGGSGNVAGLGDGGGGFGGNAPDSDAGASGGDLGGTGGSLGSSGGNGGPGAGGGAGPDDNGGNGGFGGGGGTAASGNGGSGGFGGGGGSGGNMGGGGGFGGGLGSDFGGGGAGFGGAIFVNNTAALVLSHARFANNSAAGGSGNQSGQGKGGALFILSTVNAVGNHVTFSGDSAPQAGFNSPNPYGIAGAYVNNTLCPGQDTVDICGIVADLEDIQIVSGNNQGAATTRAIAQPFIVQTQRSEMSGNAIAFTIVPNGGAGGTFPGGVISAMVNTDANGYATSPQLTANNVAGMFTVTATDGIDTLIFNVGTTACVTNPAVSSTAADNLSNPATGTLRWAVNNACAGSTITFSSGIASPIALTPDTFNGRLRIDDNLTIRGPGAANLAVDGGHRTRLFFIGGGNVTISGLTLQNGLGQGGNSGLGGGAAGMGGAIFQNGGSLAVSGVAFSGNEALGGNTGVSADAGGGFGGNGGANIGGSGGDLFVPGGGPGQNGGPGAGGGIGGNGGFGGGGGLSDSGGFGGGGGEPSGGGGFGGGGGAGSGGGGGAGFGGAVFENAGTLALVGDQVNNNSAVGGSGNGTSGQGKGGALFIYFGATATNIGSTFGASDVNIAANAGQGGIGNSASPYVTGATCPGQDTVDICGMVTNTGTISPTAGNNQTVSTGAPLATLTATLSPATANVPITFTVNPGTNGAGATFNGATTSATVNTNANGTATAPTLTANGTQGPYTITASIGSLSATFNVTNQLVTSVNVSSAMGQYGGPVQLNATVGPVGSAFSGTLQFQIDNVNAGSAIPVTGPGPYSTNYPIIQAAGPHGLSAIFTATSANTVNSSGSLNNGLTVSKAPLTVTANNASRPFGAANPAFTASDMGFAFPGDTSKVTGSPSLTTTAGVFSLPGPYTIVAAQGTLTSAYYTFNFVNGTLTVKTTGSVPVSGTACNGAYTGNFNGNLTVASNQTCAFVNGSINGSVTVNGALTLGNAKVYGTITAGAGSTVNVTGGAINSQGDNFSLIATNPAAVNLFNTSANWTVQVTGGGDIDIEGTHIYGSLVTQKVHSILLVNGSIVEQNVNLSGTAGVPSHFTTSGRDTLCNTTIGGTLTLQNSTAPFGIGDGNGCTTVPPSPQLSVHVDGGVVLTGNASVTINRNYINGILACAANNPVPSESAKNNIIGLGGTGECAGF